MVSKAWFYIRNNTPISCSLIFKISYFLLPLSQSYTFGALSVQIVALLELERKGNL